MQRKTEPKTGTTAGTRCISYCVVQAGQKADTKCSVTTATFAKNMKGAKMPSKTERQARFMAAMAHNPTLAKEHGIPQSVAQEYNKADAGTGILRKAMTNGKTQDGRSPTR